MPSGALRAARPDLPSVYAERSREAPEPTSTDSLCTELLKRVEHQIREMDPARRAAAERVVAEAFRRVASASEDAQAGMVLNPDPSPRVDYVPLGPRSPVQAYLGPTLPELDLQAEYQHWRDTQGFNPTPAQQARLDRMNRAAVRCGQMVSIWSL